MATIVTKMKSAAARWARAGRWVVGAGIALLAFWLLAREISWPAVLGALRSADYRWVAAGVLAIVGTFFARTRRWQVLLWHTRVPTRPAMTALLVGQVVNLALPMRSGDVARPPGSPPATDRLPRSAGQHRGGEGLGPAGPPGLRGRPPGLASSPGLVRPLHRRDGPGPGRRRGGPLGRPPLAGNALPLGRASAGPLSRRMGPHPSPLLRRLTNGLEGLRRPGAAGPRSSGPRSPGGWARSPTGPSWPPSASPRPPRPSSSWPP